MKKPRFSLMTVPLVLAMVVVAIVNFITPAYAADPPQKHDAVFFVGKTTYQADGYAKTMDVAPYTANGRIYVPVRYLAEALGLAVDWNAETESVTLAGEKEIKLVIKQKTMIVNGNPVNMDVVPVTYQGRTMLPARWVAEALGYTVYWFDKLKTVHVWPVVDVQGVKRVPKGNIHPISSYMKIYKNSKDAYVETIAGNYTIKNAFTVPYDTFFLQFQETLRMFGFPVDYNLAITGDNMIIYGGRRKAHIAIGSEKCNERTDWFEPFGDDWVHIKKPYRALNGSWMIQTGIETLLTDILFGKGSDINGGLDNSSKEYREFRLNTRDMEPDKNYK